MDECGGDDDTSAELFEENKDRASRLEASEGGKEDGTIDAYATMRSAIGFPYNM